MSGNFFKVIAASLAVAGTAAQAATPSRCVTSADAEALFTLLLPDALDAVGRGCQSALPETAMLRQGLGQLVARYRAETSGTEAGAQRAIQVIAGEKLEGADPSAVTKVIQGVLTTQLAKSIKPADCERIDQAVRLLSPLPARNVAGVTLMLLEIGTRGRSNSPVPICRAERQ